MISCVCRHLDSHVTLDHLLGFNNTGNVCKSLSSTPVCVCCLSLWFTVNITNYCFTLFLLQSTESIGTHWLLDLCNGIVKEGCIPEDWKSSVILSIYKGKGHPMECGSYRGIKLVEHAMKVVVSIFEHRVRQQIEVDDMQFGFMKGKGTTDAIFTVRQMQENFRVK